MNTLLPLETEQAENLADVKYPGFKAAYNKWEEMTRRILGSGSDGVSLMEIV